MPTSSVVTPAPAPPAVASPCAVSSPTLAASTAPSTDTPTVPPIERKNETVELAAPRSVGATEFCTASTRFCIVMPRPRPMTKRKAPMSTRCVSWSIVASIANPATMNSAPTTR